MSVNAVTVKGLGKRYRIGLKEEANDSLASAIGGLLKAPFKSFRKLRSLSKFNEGDSADTFWALRDISFEVKKGEVLGVIGKNGAGKSTLLKLLSRITAPTAGEMIIDGRVASLLEVGTGFHPELTGRENVFLNGTVLGMTKAEVAAKFDEIVEFSGIGKFIDTPVKRYSSGMRVRLAFSVAAHLEPDILIVDEVLAVGDYDFQKKCLGKMQDVSGEGRTVLFVSHNMVAVENLCDRAIVLEKGTKIFDGTTEDAIKKYMQVEAVGSGISLVDNPYREGSGEYQYSKVYFTDSEGQSIQTGFSGRDFYIHLEVDQRDKSAGELKVNCAMGVFESSGMRLFSLSTIALNKKMPLKPGKNLITWHIPKLPLANGEYNATIFMSKDDRGMEPVDWIKEAFSFTVERGDFYGTGQQLLSQRDLFFVNHDISISATS